MLANVSAPLDLELEREKYREFVDGHFVERFLGADLHSDCQFQVTALLKLLAQATNAKARQKWTVAHEEEWLIPDVVLTRPNDYVTDSRGYLVSTPLLCVEILSPGQSASDLFRKCRRYHAWGVPHCWIIDPQAKACFESHDGDTFALIECDGTLTAGEIRFRAAELFAA